jgi:hypothetical protein
MERDGKLQVNPLFGGGVQERWGTHSLELKIELVQSVHRSYLSRIL